MGPRGRGEGDRACATGGGSAALPGLALVAAEPEAGGCA